MENEKNNPLGIPPSKKTPFLPLIVATVLISAFFGSLFGAMSNTFMQKIILGIEAKYPTFFSAKQQNNSTGVTQQQVIQEDSAVIDVVKKSTPAVVSIVVSKDVSKVKDFFNFFDPFGDGSGSQDQGGATQKQTIGGGSGFLITSDGMIVTNKHVVADTAADYTVLTDDKQEHPAKVLARDPVNDIAVIKIEGSNYPTLNLGDSDALQIGQTVIAIGNSLGEFSNTVSRGIVSGLKRSLTASGGLGDSERLSNIIQTDAAINPGNSGGPLLNINGEVIGVNVAIAQGAQNIGFALPSNQISKIINQVKTTGKISTPYIGVRYVLVNKDIQTQNNLAFDYGALILRGQQLTDFAVIPGSPADKAGLVENDIILEINGIKIDENNSLSDVIAKYNIGDQLKLKVWHKGETKDISLTLTERK